MKINDVRDKSFFNSFTHEGGANGGIFIGRNREEIDAKIAQAAEQERLGRQQSEAYERAEEQRRSQLSSHQLAELLLSQPDQAVLVASSDSIVRVGTVIQTEQGVFVGDSEYEPDSFGDGELIKGDRLF